MITDEAGGWLTPVTVEWVRQPPSPTLGDPTSAVLDHATRLTRVAVSTRRIEEAVRACCDRHGGRVTRMAMVWSLVKRSDVVSVPEGECVGEGERVQRRADFAFCPPSRHGIATTIRAAANLGIQWQQPRLS